MPREKSLYSSYSGGPVGYGDPDSTYISDSERSSILSKFVQEKLLTELCVKEWKEWKNCVNNQKDKWFPASKCKHLFNVVNQCQNQYLMNPEKVKELEDEYLRLRSEFRRTGIGHSFMNRDKIREI